MGFFNDSNDPYEKTNELMEQQIRENQAELEAKRQSLYQERLAIIKGQGGQSFTPDRTAGVGSSSGGSNFPDFSKSWFKGF